MARAPPPPRAWPAGFTKGTEAEAREGIETLAEAFSTADGDCPGQLAAKGVGALMDVRPVLFTGRSDAWGDY